MLIIDKSIINFDGIEEQMDIENMKAFVTVAELKSISAAANRLNHLQSNMTAKIKKIETHYQLDLFTRSSKGVSLTEEGEKLYHQFKKILFIWEETENKMKSHVNTIRIGSMPSLGGLQFSNSLYQMHKVYPDLKVTLKTGSTAYIEQQILLGHIDIAYTIGTHDNKRIHYQNIGREELVLIGNNIDHYTNLLDYLPHKNVLILSEKCLYQSILNKMMTDMNIEPGEYIEVNDQESIKQFIQMGMGITLIPKRLLIRYNVSNYIEIPQLYRYLNLYIITRKDHQLTPIEKQFIVLNSPILRNE